MTSFESFRRELEELASRMGVAVVIRESVDSTNDVARRMLGAAEAGREPDALVSIVAWGQERGRGRRGRSWVSPPGRGIYATVMASRLAQSRLQLLPLGMVVSVARALSPWLSSPLSVKWPNDLMIGEAKVGGILIEAVSQGATCRALAGIGINFGPPVPSVPNRQATALSSHLARERSLAEMTMDVLVAVRRAFGVESGGEDLAEQLGELVAERTGDRLRVETGAGFVEGAFKGFDRHGRLLLATPQGIRRLAAGQLVEW